MIDASEKATSHPGGLWRYKPCGSAAVSFDRQAGAGLGERAVDGGGIAILLELREARMRKRVAVLLGCPGSGEPGGHPC